MVTHGNQYVALAYHFNKEIQEQGLRTVHFVGTLFNIADMTSKCVDGATRKNLQGSLSGHDLRLIKKTELEVLAIYDKMRENVDL